MIQRLDICTREADIGYFPRSVFIDEFRSDTTGCLTIYTATVELTV